ncbi:hypothetical protein FZEAL_7484 [Fusarium zealandicum]|uniref:Citrate transporter-like domain-containing protein n=1 Tax=Fusarium zealandicum TaxID=1053134 RepID=A0A8H4UGG6_9HYPO|nr:hypothetical protein FZEAL_7484 [Fusarium zealandicum]
MSDLLDTSAIREWRSIVTLVAFVVANIIVLFPFHLPIYVPKPLVNSMLDTLSASRITSPQPHHGSACDHEKCTRKFVRFDFPFNYITAPLIADLFLLAISAIGRQEVHDGTIGADNINPLDIMIFFITLAYIAISIDASGLIRFLAFKVLQWGGEGGQKLFFYLYVFFFALGSFVGNDPIILSGTAFLAYMTRVSKNIKDPRAWIHTQFAVANISSAILVSSNPTNLVLAGAFEIKFIDYTANMIVPVVVTAIVLFPFLLWVLFQNEDLIPSSIEMHTLSEEARDRRPVNPNIPYVRRQVAEQDDLHDGRLEMVLSLEEIMNPFLDIKGAAFGAVIMAATLVTLLAINAASTGTGKHHVFWVTLPAAFIMFCWDLMSGWIHREETRNTAASYRKELERTRERRSTMLEQGLETTHQDRSDLPAIPVISGSTTNSPMASRRVMTDTERDEILPHVSLSSEERLGLKRPIPRVVLSGSANASPILISPSAPQSPIPASSPSLLDTSTSPEPHDLQSETLSSLPSPKLEEKQKKALPGNSEAKQERASLVSLAAKASEKLQETFPTVMAVMSHLPFALVPFAFAMFVLVQGLVSKGWVPVFAYGWDHWVKKTGTVGSIGGMGFLSVVLCNFSGTNIGTTILLSRVIQAWQQIHRENGIPISNRTFWAAIYSMALGVNYGAFSTAFSQE